MDALPHRSLVNPSKLVSSRIGIFEGVGILKQDSGRLWGLPMILNQHLHSSCLRFSNSKVWGL